MPLWCWLQELLDGRWNDCVPDQEHSLGDTLPRNSVPRGLFVYTAVTRDGAARRTIPLVERGAARTFVAHCNGVARVVARAVVVVVVVVVRRWRWRRWWCEVDHPVRPRDGARGAEARTGRTTPHRARARRARSVPGHARPGGSPRARHASSARWCEVGHPVRRRGGARGAQARTERRIPHRARARRAQFLAGHARPGGAPRARHASPATAGARLGTPCGDGAAHGGAQACTGRKTPHRASGGPVPS